MTNIDTSRRTTSVAPVLAGPASAIAYVDWGAIFAGAVVTAAISTLMTTFGAAIGLSAASPFAGKGLSATALGVASGLWVLWIAVSSFVIGGYLAGRMRRRVHDASEHESDIRDGAHGLVVWAIGVMLIAYLATSSAAGLAKTAVGATATVATEVGAKLAESADPFGFATDRLLRSTNATAVTGDAAKQDVMRVLASSAANGTITPDDKTYLANVVAARAGVTPQEAAKRIDDTMAQIATATEKAKQAADTARKISILIAFLTTASLVISAAAAWWAACKGGNHRDEGVDLSHLTAWR